MATGEEGHRFNWEGLRKGEVGSERGVTAREVQGFAIDGPGLHWEFHVAGLKGPASKLCSHCGCGSNTQLSLLSLTLQRIEEATVLFVPYLCLPDNYNYKIKGILGHLLRRSVS